MLKIKVFFWEKKVLLPLNDGIRMFSMNRDNNSPSKVESLQSRLAQAQDDIRDERRRSEQISEKLRQCQVDLETLPILRHA